MSHETAQRRGASSSSPLDPVWRFALALALLLVAAPSWGAKVPDPCDGHRVRVLHGPHAIAKTSIKSLADLQKRLPELEGPIREAIAQAGLDPAVADQIVTAIRNGQAPVAKLGPTDQFVWMSYRPKPGTVGLIDSPCRELKKSYDAFEFTITTQPPAPPPQDARCALSVTRNCEHENPTITVDATGSSANVRLEHGGQPVSGTGPRWTVQDTAPYSEEAAFVVHAQAADSTASLTAKQHRFLMPLVCGNLAYMGSTDVPANVAVASRPCEKSASAPMCKPWCEVSVDPQTVEVHHAANVRSSGGWHDGMVKVEAACADDQAPIALDTAGGEFTPGHVCCGHDGFDITCEAKNAAGEVANASAQLAVTPHVWTFRPSLVYYMPQGSDLSGDLTIPVLGSAHESFSIDDGLGVDAALEKRINDRWGIEAAAMFGQVETTYELTTGGESGQSKHNANFYAFTVGPDLHLLKCTPDLYVGLFVGYGGLADPNYWVNGHHFHADLSGDFVWGGLIGLDVPFSKDSDWGFHGGLRYFQLSQDTDAGSIDVDPLVLEAGLSYKF